MRPRPLWDWLHLLLRRQRQGPPSRCLAGSAAGPALQRDVRGPRGGCRPHPPPTSWTPAGDHPSGGCSGCVASLAPASAFLLLLPDGGGASPCGPWGLLAPPQPQGAFHPQMLLWPCYLQDCVTEGTAQMGLTFGNALVDGQCPERAVPLIVWAGRVSPPRSSAPSPGDAASACVAFALAPVTVSAILPGPGLCAGAVEASQKCVPALLWPLSQEGGSAMVGERLPDPRLAGVLHVGLLHVASCPV